MTADSEPLARLAQCVERRIAELALEYAEAARAAGISDETLSKIRKGIKARGSTYRKLERALQWEAGSVAAILAGGDPLLTAGHAGDVAGVEGEVARSADGQALSLRDLEILQDLVVSTASRLGLTEEETDEAYRRARVELERRRSVEAESPSPSPRRRSVG